MCVHVAKFSDVFRSRLSKGIFSVYADPLEVGNLCVTKKTSRGAMATNDGSL